MADTDVRIIQDVEACVDDSPPVCLVPLAPNKLSSQLSPDKYNSRDLSDARDSSAATSNMAPTVLQATSECTLHTTTEDSSMPAAEIKDVCSDTGASKPACAETAAVPDETKIVELGRADSLDAALQAVAVDANTTSPASDVAPNEDATTADINTAPVVRNSPVPSPEGVVATNCVAADSRLISPALQEPAVNDEEDDDFDLEDRPLTVDVSHEPGLTYADQDTGKETTSTVPDHESQHPTSTESVPTTTTSVSNILPSVSTDTAPSSQPDVCIAPTDSAKLNEGQAEPTVVATLTSTLDIPQHSTQPIASEMTPPEESSTSTPPSTNVVEQVTNSVPQTNTDLPDPTISLANKTETSIVSVPCSPPSATSTTSVLDIRPKPTTPQPTVLPIVSSGATTVVSSSAALVTSQTNNVQILPVAPGPTGSATGVPLGNLTATGTGLPLPGTGAGTGGPLQILNMTPMPQFMGTPGVVLHPTGTPTFQPGTTILPGLPTPGLGAGATFNFLQPNSQQFATMLQPPIGTGGDYMLDAQLGLSHQLVPHSSISLFNPMNPCSSMVESYAPTHLSPFYHTLVQPPGSHNQPFLPSSTSVFIPPNYRPSTAGVTNLVNATTSQMATSMSGGPGPNIFPTSLAGNPSVGAGGMFLQTTPAPLLSPPFGHSTTPLFQNPFSSYSVPLQGPTDACLPSTIASGLATKTTSIYRFDDLNMVQPPGSSALPPLWTAPSSLPTICPTPQSTPLTNSTPIAPSSSSIPNVTSLLPQPPALQPCPAVSKQLRTFHPLISASYGRNTLPIMRASSASTTVTNVLPKTSTLPGTGRLAGIMMPNSTTILPAIRRRRPPLHPAKSKQQSIGSQRPSLSTSEGGIQPGLVSSTTGTPITTTPLAVARISLSTEVTLPSVTVISSEAVSTAKSPSSVPLPSPSLSPISIAMSPVPSTSDRHYSTSVRNELSQSLTPQGSTRCLSQPTVTHNSQLNGSYDPVETSRMGLGYMKTSLLSPTQSPIDAARRSSNSVLSSSTHSSPGYNSSSTSPANQRKSQSPVSSSTISNHPKMSVASQDNVELHSSLERLGMSFKSATHDVHRGPTTPLEATGLLPVHRKASASNSHGGSQKMPPPLLHHGPEGLRIWMHVVGGHVIYESNKPFPVKNGMSVVEAALLNECLNEEKAVASDVVSPSKRSSELQPPVVNGHELMQLEDESQEQKSSDERDAPRKRLSGSMEVDGRMPQVGPLRLSNGPSSSGNLGPLNSIEHTPKPLRSTDEQPTSSHEVRTPTTTSSALHTTGPSGDAELSKGTGVTIRTCRASASSLLSTATSVVGAMSSSIPAAAQPRPPQQPGFFQFAQHPHTPQLPTPPPPGPVRKWTPEDVVAFVQGTPGCAAYASAFLTNEIDGEALLLLAKDQFIHPPIGMKIGPALKLAARLESIRHIN